MISLILKFNILFKFKLIVLFRSFLLKMVTSFTETLNQRIDSKSFFFFNSLYIIITKHAAISKKKINLFRFNFSFLYILFCMFFSFLIFLVDSSKKLKKEFIYYDLFSGNNALWTNNGLFYSKSFLSYKSPNLIHKSDKLKISFCYFWFSR